METSQSEHEEEMSFEQKFSQQFSTEGNLRSHCQAFRKGLFTRGGGSAFPPHRLLIPSLVLLNAVLLIAAIVIGVYCAKAKDPQIPSSDVTPHIAEMDYLHNHSNIVKEKVRAQAELERERASHLQLKLQMKQKETIIDGLQKQIVTLQTEKTNLQMNKTNFEDSCAKCPLEWFYLNSSCYYFSARVSNAKKNWVDSRADCRSRGADMLVINNMEEQQMMIYFVPMPSPSTHWWQGGTWIGFSRGVGDVAWAWVNNATEMKYMYWKTGQPSHDGLQKGNCGASYFLSQTTHTWYNADCHGNQLHWICEMAPN